MHSLSHSLAHRGPSASRARSRWQPYASTSLSNASTPPALARSPQTYLHTPTSVVLPPASSSSFISPAINLERSRSANLNATAKPLSVSGGPIREHKFKYVAGLVDQAVKSLCDNWHPDEIPLTFRAKASEPGLTQESSVPAEEPLIHHTVRNVQLPSPLSPSTYPSPISTSPITPTAQIAAASCRSSQVIPLRGFVHEVLRRSRTSTSVLQTALCYLEAIRTKVPELVRREQAKQESSEYDFEVKPEERIVLGEEYFQINTMSDVKTQEWVDTIKLGEHAFQGPLTAPPTEILPTIDALECMAPHASASTKQKSPPLPPLPPLPSPLLCPRRTFLACLILASKFLQDRSYSNKAWAKLAGLPPREIGRCERAVGEALEWRLWVGKVPSTATSTPVAPTHRAVARCRSEGNVGLPSCSFLTTTAPAAQLACRLSAMHFSTSLVSSGLRRSATMPELGDEDYCARLGLSIQPSTDARPFFTATSLSADSDTDMSPNGSQAGFAESLPSSQMGSIFAFIPSPPLSTPTLSYSPMSTASSTSSDDGERTVQFPSFVDIPDYQSSGLTGKSTGRPLGLPYIVERPSSYVKLAAIDPKVSTMPVRLPPLSEAVSHSAFNIEHYYQAVPVFSGVGAGVGDSVSVYNSYYGTWSVSG